MANHNNMQRSKRHVKRTRRQRGEIKEGNLIIGRDMNARIGEKKMQ